MTQDNFSQIVLALKNNDQIKSDAYKLGIDLIGFDDDLHKVINLLIEEIYGKEGLDWFSWFCWESDFGEKDWSKHPSYSVVNGVMEKTKEAGETRYGATDENGNPICYSILSTWEYLEKNHSKMRRNKKNHSEHPSPPRESVYGC